MMRWDNGSSLEPSRKNANNVLRLKATVLGKKMGPGAVWVAGVQNDIRQTAEAALEVRNGIERQLQ